MQELNRRRAQRLGERGWWVPWVGAMRLAGHGGFTADGASTLAHGAASAGHGGWQTINIKRVGGCGMGVGVPGGPEAGFSRPQAPGRPPRPCGSGRCRRRRGDDRARAGAVRRAACAEPICGTGGWQATRASPPMERVRRSRTESASAGHGGWQGREGRGCAVPNAAEVTIQRTRHGASPRGRLADPRWPEFARVGGRVVVPRRPELERGDCVRDQEGAESSTRPVDLERVDGWVVVGLHGGATPE